MSKANYGLDAPGVVKRFLGLGAILLALGFVSMIGARKWLPNWAAYFATPLLAMGFTFACQGAVMIWGSKVGKLRLRDRLLNQIPWRGDERVLDVGCGHGLMLIGAAKRLKSGKAVGIDLWQAEDQAGNSRAATQQNILAEGVADRAELLDGDARKLPFPDESFDVVLSSWALHNIYDAPGRETALHEIIRVLKRGARLTIVDIRHTAEYEEVLRKAQLRDVCRQGPNFLFVIPSYVVTGTRT